MIIPMKKISLLVLDTERKQALKELRKLGLVHITEAQGTSEKLSQLKEQVAKLERADFTITEVKEKKAKIEGKSVGTEEALSIADQVAALAEAKKDARSKINSDQVEIERISKWGDFHPQDFETLAEKGIYLTPYEMPLEDYNSLGEDIQTILVNSDKTTARVLVLGEEASQEKPEELPLAASKLVMPKYSIQELNEDIEKKQNQVVEIDADIRSNACYLESMKDAIRVIQKEMEFETYQCSMMTASVSDDPAKEMQIASLNGYIPTEDLPKLQEAAKQHGWGIAAEDPTEEDNVPTKLRNNKFVSLIYPLTDFLGTVPGYFEYDISGWFLGFMLIFFGIIFGDGGYGLLITAVAAALILKAKKNKEEVKPLFLLIGLFGIATMLWGMVTCTWFGLEVESIPVWLQKLSIPVISNVNESRIWYPFWMNGTAGLTTAQNLQIFCFALALFQLSVAHIKGMIRYRKSLKVLGDVGSLLQLWGIFYVVLTLVVSSEIFGLTRSINGIPVGTISIALVAVGFVLSFIFGSYEGSIKDSVLDSIKNIISILLGVVNVFSDIVSYIRLWAVGLAGAAISATVNEMAGPMFGHLAFILVAVILLVFGHGLNMILNLLSVIVHGVRLNTLEFSTHLDMSWSGHKYEPFEE